MSHAVQIARTARTNSSIRASGRDHVIEYRRVMCCCTWLPRPRRSRPPLRSWTLRADIASVIGERANAIATAVPRPMWSVALAASASAMNGSVRVSGTHRQS